MSRERKNYGLIDLLIKKEKQGLAPKLGALAPMYRALESRDVIKLKGEKKTKDAELLRSVELPESPVYHNGRFECGFKFQDVASNNGIPDYVCIHITPPARITEKYGGDTLSAEEVEEGNKARMKLLEGNPTLKTCLILSDSFDNVAKVNISKTKGNSQALTGSCNAREEASVKLAARLSRLNFSAFVTKATLCVAKFINFHRRNEQEQPYLLGEVYDFMRHGERMRDAFTPEEVQQAMEKVGISGSRVANDLMAELERLRDARMNPEAGSMDVPE